MKYILALIQGKRGEIAFPGGETNKKEAIAIFLESFWWLTEGRCNITTSNRLLVLVDYATGLQHQQQWTLLILLNCPFFFQAGGGARFFFWETASAFGGPIVSIFWPQGLFFSPSNKNGPLFSVSQNEKMLPRFKTAHKKKMDQSIFWGKTKLCQKNNNKWRNIDWNIGCTVPPSCRSLNRILYKRKLLSLG